MVGGLCVVGAMIFTWLYQLGDLAFLIKNEGLSRIDVSEAHFILCISLDIGDNM
jgi:hypothetical protein